MIEYRVCWSASSNISFRGATDWEPWGDDATAREVEDALYASTDGVSDVLEIALEASGFEFYVETREA